MWLLPSDPLSDALFLVLPYQYPVIPSHTSLVSRAAVARPQMVGSPTPKVARSGEEQPSSPATTEGESHIKAPPSTSEVARPSVVGRGRLLGYNHINIDEVEKRPFVEIVLVMSDERAAFGVCRRQIQ